MYWYCKHEKNCEVLLLAKRVYFSLPFGTRCKSFWSLRCSGNLNHIRLSDRSGCCSHIYPGFQEISVNFSLFASTYSKQTNVQQDWSLEQSAEAPILLLISASQFCCIINGNNYFFSRQKKIKRQENVKHHILYIVPDHYVTLATFPFPLHSRQ